MISIIVPIFNAAAYLPVCLDSLLGQTERDIQVLLVDDGSTDGSLAIADAYAAQDARINVLQQPHAGQSVARNNGLTHAQGDFIAFVDADDSLAPDWCERHLAAIEGVDYVQSGYKRVVRSEAGLEELEDQCPRHTYQFVSPCMRLYRREAIRGLRFEEGMIYEDVLWSLDLWLRNTTCRMIRYDGYLYTLNPHSTTSRPHPDAQRHVMSELKKRMRGATLRGKMILLLTILRLKAHFLRS